jgi:hypothetical protein
MRSHLSLQALMNGWGKSSFIGSAFIGMVFIHNHALQSEQDFT